MARDPEYAKRYYLANKERMNRKGRESYRKNKAARDLQNREWALTNPDRVQIISKRHRLKSHGLSEERWNEIFEGQDRACAVCKNSYPDSKRVWHIDHDHSCCDKPKSCGKCVRGILCGNCNSMLGHEKDSIFRLNNAVSYLRSFISKQSRYGAYDHWSVRL